MMKCFSILSLVFLAACGQPTSNYKTPLEKVIFTNYSNEAPQLKKQISICNQYGFSDNQNELTFSIRLDNSVVPRTEDFSTLLSGNYLRDGKIISASVYGESVDIVKQSGVSFEKTLTNSKHINFCSTDNEYQEDTIESAALSTAFFIKKTYEKFTSVIKDVKLSPIRLNISPSITTSTIFGTTKESMYWADNALYIPKIKTIIFLPSSANSGVTDFWEVPMVASHEYGHHIFNTIHGSVDEQMSHESCLGDHSAAMSQWDDERKVTRQSVLSALNEGFADLIAHYSLEQNEIGIKGVPCLDTTRDVLSSSFINGKLKNFNSQAMFMFFENTSKHYGTCYDPSFQETHIFGATFAHTADAFMNSLGGTREQKLETIVKWVQSLNANKQKYNSLSPKNYFQVAYTQFITMALEQFNSDFNPITCATIKDLAPAIEFKKCEGI